MLHDINKVAHCPLARGQYSVLVSTVILHALRLKYKAEKESAEIIWPTVFYTSM